MSITKIAVSVGTNQAIVVASTGESMALLLNKDHPVSKTKAELIGDAKSGKLSTYMAIFGGDTKEEISSTEAEAQDWETIYTGE